MSGDFTLDHVGVMVRNLDQGESAYRRLGFTLTPRSFHSGARQPGGPIEPWGSGNHCGMFRSGYLEIQGITDPNLYSSAKLTLARYEGAHIVALRCDNAETAFAQLKSAGAAIAPPILMQRKAAFGPHDEETRLAQFKLVYADRDANPEARFITIEHVTPDVLWQQHLLDHPNGALSLSETWICVDDPAKVESRFAALFGAAPRQDADGLLRYDLKEGAILVLSPERLAAHLPGAVAPCVPYVAGFGVGVRDLGTTEALLTAAGVTFTRLRDGLLVGPEFTFGPVLRFHPHAGGAT